MKRSVTTILNKYWVEATSPIRVGSRHVRIQKHLEIQIQLNTCWINDTVC